MYTLLNNNFQKPDTKNDIIKFSNQTSEINISDSRYQLDEYY